MRKNKKRTNEDLKQEAAQYKTKTLFQYGSPSAYQIAYKRGILDNICKHMPKYDRKGETNPRFRWTNEKLYVEGLKYTSRQEFRKKSYAAYLACKRRGILDEVCSHMQYLYHYWTNEEILKEGLKYNHPSEFERKNLSAYYAARYRGILSKACSHMKRTSFSVLEQELRNIIKEQYPSAKQFRDNKVKIINKTHIKGFDIDIYILELKKGIEFDGTYHHSFGGLKRGRPHWPDEDVRNYHKIKDNWFKSRGIEILHIKEKDWLKDKEKCIYKCLAFLNNSDKIKL